MNKIKGIIFMLLGLFLLGYNYFFRAVHTTSSAVLQLEDSDVLYGVGAGVANGNISLLLNLLAVIFICYGVYNYYSKEKKTNEKND